jgi:putative glycosyltransferase (TIGR04348 family)
LYAPRTHHHSANHATCAASHNGGLRLPISGGANCASDNRETKSCKWLRNRCNCCARSRRFNRRASAPVLSNALCDSSAMKSSVVIVSPANAKANNGNWHTAARWARFLSPDYAVKIVERWSINDAMPQVMLALHARRSAESIAQFRHERPHGGLVLALTGTDVYGDIHSDASAQRSLALADRLILLQPNALTELPVRHHHKCDVVFQSAPTLTHAAPAARHFDVVQVGHLRHEKDPFTPITALRLLPAASRIRLKQIGTALDAHHSDTLAVVLANEPRLRWLGGLSRAQTRQHIKRARLLVIASRMEGGANVIVEAVTAGTPVIASHISGNIGMLGEDYPGYFPFGDAAACAALMARAETDSRFMKQLTAACAKRAKLFAPEREAAAIGAVVARVGPFRDRQRAPSD